MYKENKKVSRLVTNTTAVLIVAMLLVTSFLAIADIPSEPHNANAIWIEPSTVSLTTANPLHTIGYKFNITVWLNMSTLVSPAVGVDTWQVKVFFNPAHLHAVRTGYTNTTASRSDLFELFPTTPVIPIINNVAGYVFHGETCAPNYRAAPCYGSLCWIEFNVTAVPAEGQTMSDVFNIKNSDTWLADDQSNYYPPDGPITQYNGNYQFVHPSLTHTLTVTSTVGGTTNPAPGSHSYAQGTLVSVTAIPDAGYKLDHWELDEADVGATNPIQVVMDTDHTLHAVFSPVTIEGTILYVDPPEIIDPNMVPSSTFTINITIDDVANMHICEFNLTYNTAILSWMTIEVFKVQNQTPSSKVICDDEAGYVWVKLTYPSSITTDSPLALVRITFHVDAMGATPLNLNNTKLTDPMGQPIPHTAIGGFFASLIQDLAITNVVPSRNWVYQGELVDINVTAKNLGNQKESFDVKTYYDIELIGTQHVTDLAPDAEVTLTFTWNTSLVEPCTNYTIKAEATILPYETKTADNTYIDGTVKIFATDLTVTNVVTSCEWVYQGQTVNINVTVKNLGVRYESFDVKAYYDTELIGTKHVTDLPPKTEVTLVITWNTSLVTPCHNYTITGEATILPFEANTDNNKYVDGTIKVRFVGDLNGDGKVDMMDLREIAEAFASYPGHPKWNPDADINQDGKVDMRDIRLAAKNFGKGCT